MVASYSTAKLTYRLKGPMAAVYTQGKLKTNTIHARRTRRDLNHGWAPERKNHPRAAKSAPPTSLKILAHGKRECLCKLKLDILSSGASLNKSATSKSHCHCKYYRCQPGTKNKHSPTCCEQHPTCKFQSAGSRNTGVHGQTCKQAVKTTPSWNPDSTL